MDNTLRDSINDILNQRQKVKGIQESIKESVAEVAERFDMKPAQLNKIIGLVEKERDKGGVLSAERELLDMAEEV